MTTKKEIIYSCLAILLIIIFVEGASTIYVYKKHGINLWNSQAKVPAKFKAVQKYTDFLKDDEPLPARVIRELHSHGNFTPNLLYGFQMELDKVPNNNYFLNDEVDFPYKKKNKDELVIGLFGGSVAAELFYEIQHNKKNKELVHKILGTDNVKILNFSVSAMSQPQQSILMNTFVDSIDISINIDGHNEMGLKRNSSYPIEFPIGTDRVMLKHILNQKKEKDVSLFMEQANSIKTNIKDLKKAYGNLSKSTLLSTFASYFHTGFIFFFSMNKYYSDKITEKVLELDQLIGNRTSPKIFTVSERYNNWKKYIRLQNHTAKLYSVKSYFFLQPNPFSKVNKVFSEEELGYVHKGVAGMDELIEAYDIFHNGVEELQKEGIRIYSLRDLFLKVPETIYVDNCCHINKRGSAMMIEHVFQTIAHSF